jgi:hypothetical protein
VHENLNSTASIFVCFNWGAAFISWTCPFFFLVMVVIFASSILVRVIQWFLVGFAKKGIKMDRVYSVDDESH